MVNIFKTALISGVDGQDGSYMAEYLIANGYKVFGLTRNNIRTRSRNIQHLNDQFDLINTSYELDQIISIISDIEPNEIYNFAGQSFVSKSWSIVEETIHSQGVIVSRFLEAISLINSDIKFLNASSSEIFAPDTQSPLNEKSLVKPYNPYGCAQLLGHTLVDSYRDAKYIYAVNAILFPHESPRRNNQFVFKKIIDAAIRIKMGSDEILTLGNLNVKRDWGYAPSFVVAMHRLMLINEPSNLCICTGNAQSVIEVVKLAFESLDLDWERYVKVNPSLLRHHEPNCIVGDPSTAIKKIGWQSSTNFVNLINRMIDFEIKIYGSDEKSFVSEQPFFN